MKVKMKRVFFIAVAAMAIAACGPKLTNEQKVEAFKAEYQSIIDDFEKTDGGEAATDSAIARIVDLGLSTALKYPKDSVALEAIESCLYYADPEDLKNVLEKLSDELKQSEFIQSVSGSIEAKIATKEGQPFVDFTVDNVTGTDAEGNPVIEKKSLSDFVGKGKVVLVDFWSPWCYPCKQEIPNIKAVYEKNKGENFDVLSVAVWEESAHMNWQNTIDTAAVYNMDWNLLNNGHQEPSNLYGIDGIPHIILFGVDGTILKRDLRGEALEAAVAEALAN